MSGWVIKVLHKADIFVTSTFKLTLMIRKPTSYSVLHETCKVLGPAPPPKFKTKVLPISRPWKLHAKEISKKHRESKNADLNQRT